MKTAAHTARDTMEWDENPDTPLSIPEFFWFGIFFLFQTYIQSEILPHNLDINLHVLDK